MYFQTIYLSLYKLEKAPLSLIKIPLFNTHTSNSKSENQLNQIVIVISLYVTYLNVISKIKKGEGRFIPVLDDSNDFVYLM